MNYKYKFYYQNDFRDISQICYSEKSALNLFVLLINQHIPFKVYTLGDKNEKSFIR